MNIIRILASTLLLIAITPTAQAQYFDKETGLHYNINRNYDASTDRYLESDPIGLRGGINTYSYALGNPLKWIDPLGLNPGDVYGTPDAAAVDAGNYSRKNCRDGFECGGWVYQKDNGYAYNYIQGKKYPNKITNDESSACRPDNPIAGWHKHPWYRDIPLPDDGMPVNHFSDNDMRWVDSYEKIPLYLSAPSGVDRVYEPRSGERLVR